MYNLQWKKTFLICSVVLIGLSAQAQRKTLHLEDHDLKPYYFGITLGVNSSRFHMNHHPVFMNNDSIAVAEPANNSGFSLGLSATARLNKRLEVRFNPQLIFAQKSIDYNLITPDTQKDEQKIMNKAVESVITSFPVQLKLNSDRIGNFRVYMMGGVKADLDLASNARARQAEDLIKIKKTDYGIEAGIGFNFFFPSFIFSPELKISNGLGNIHERDKDLKYSNVIDRMQSRMIMFSIRLEG